MGWIMRTAGHDVRDRFAIVFVAGSIVFEEFVEAPNPLRHGANRLQADRHATVGECVLDALLPRLRTKIAVIDPHLRQNGETPCALRDGPLFFWKEMAHPEHHADASRQSEERERPHPGAGTTNSHRKRRGERTQSRDTDRSSLLAFSTRLHAPG